VRFAFTILDHRVSFSISKYAAPGVTIDANLQQGNLVSPLSRYSDPLPNGYGSDCWLHVDDGVQYQWTKDTNDIGLIGGDGSALAHTGSMFARAFPVKATPSAAELTGWGGSLPATIANLDGVTLNSGDVFLIQNFGDGLSDGVYTITDGSGHFAPADVPPNGSPNGHTIHVLEGTTNAGKNYWAQPDADPLQPPNFSLLPTGKILFRLVGASGALITAVVRRIIP
jgi:hypothetical protein